MTDHPDDNILDDDVEEHDFNFDNEKEDALLAETEFDHFMGKSTPNDKQKVPLIRNSTQLNFVSSHDVDPLDQEDVLDIGIAEEDIVEAETIGLPNTCDVDPEINEKVPSKKSPDFILKAVKVDNFKTKCENTSNTMEVEINEIHEVDEPANNDECASVENYLHDSEKKETGMSTVISLKTNVKKSYDNLPDLAKVIELVRPSGSSRHRKRGKISQHHFTKKKRSNDVVNVMKKCVDNFTEKSDYQVDVEGDSVDVTLNAPENVEEIPNSNSLNQSYFHQSVNHNDRRYEDEVDQSQKITNKRTFRNFVSEIQNFPNQQDMCNERSILTTVQITQERYQIARDFRITRPSAYDSASTYIPANANYSCPNPPPMSRSLVPPSAGMRPFYPATTLQASNENITQFSNSSFTASTEKRPVSLILSETISDRCLPRPAPAPAAPISFPHRLPPSIPFSQRFPIASQPSFPPPFPPPPQPRLSSNSYYYYYHQQSHALSAVSTPLNHHQLVRHPSPQSQQTFSQPPPSHFPVNTIYGVNTTEPNFSTSPAGEQRPASVCRPSYFSQHQNRPFHYPHAPPINSTAPSQTTFARRAIFNEAPQSVAFRQSQQLIQMPPPQKFFSTGQSINNQNIFARTQSDRHCTKENVISLSSSFSSSSPEFLSNTSTAYDSGGANQPSHPGMRVNHSAHSIAFTGGKLQTPIRGENDEFENSRFAREESYSNSFLNRSNEKHPYNSHEYCLSQDETISSDRNSNVRHPKRIASTSIDAISNGNSAKSVGYNYSGAEWQSTEDDMEVYRKKVEHQKEIREKFIQMKEEQRLKNQMQNFIQNNIKGILQKREQFLKKGEPRSNCTGNLPATNKEDGCSVIGEKEGDLGNRYSKENENTLDLDRNNTKNISSTTKQKEILVFNNLRTYSANKTSKPVIKNVQNTFDLKQKSPKLCSDDSAIKYQDTRQLHKVIKIKYKDGTFALKSFPVTDTANKSTSSDQKSRPIDNLNVTIHDENTNIPDSNSRRMVMSKQISSNIKHENNDKSSSGNESIIVESVRKGVTQSSVPLAQRFSNLKCGTPKDEDMQDTPLLAVKSKTRLVITDEDETRTVLIRNIGSNTKTTVIQRMACTCGHVTKISWPTREGKFRQAKITFSKPEEAKKFVHNYNRKIIDFSMIVVSLVSENK